MPRVLLLSAVCCLSTLAFAAPAAKTAPPLLPQSFAGWTESGSASTTPDPADAPFLHENGMVQYAAASYVSGSHHLSVRAMRFGDATGAYGAFTLFRQPDMHAEKIGREGAAGGDHFVFWNGTSVVDASFAAPSTDEAAALSALAAELPAAMGTQSIPPTLPHYLPAAQLDAVSVRYAVGPVAYVRAGGKLPANIVDFSLDTEALIAQYGPRGAQETLTLLLYPTPQIAATHLKAVDTLASSGMMAQRSGPLVVTVSGSYSRAKARQLLDAVKFNDYVTINHPEGYVPEGAKLYRLLMSITVLVVVLMCAALLLGLFLGGGRALVRRLRGKPVSSLAEEEFISLHLSR
ncbi:MAG TPA: DUF6599 family protein [Acidobacteriaceae bacterium]|nr:DUF6599 family protein [Acidobacteriaceae bacterium]